MRSTNAFRIRDVIIKMFPIDAKNGIRMYIRDF